MNKLIIEFIEKYINMIDNNDWDHFWVEAITTLSNNEDLYQLNEILEKAQINTLESREKLLRKYIDKAVASLHRNKQTLSMSNFIDNIPLDRRFGFNLRQIESYIIQHKDELDCEIWRDYFEWKIRRKS